MKFKKVPGERLVAAIIDAIIVGIISSIPSLVFLIINGFGSFLDFYINGAGMVEANDGYITFTVIALVTELIIGFIYFVFVPFKWNGQTLGKKILGIKAIDEFGNNPTFKQHVIRGVQVWGNYIALLTLPFLLVNLLVFSLISGLFGFLSSALVVIALILLLVREDGKGLHDMIANTYVVKADIDLDEEFIQKTTQMNDWADVDFGDEDTKKEDDWYKKNDDDEEDYWN